MKSTARSLLASAVLTAPSVALAGELDVAWSTSPAGGRGAVTMLDVVAGTIPSIELKGPEGERYRLSLELKPEADDVVTIEGRIESMRYRRNGTVRYKEVARPIVSTSDGERASLSFSPKRYLTFELHFSPRLSDSLNRPPMIERAADEPASAE
ncbi:MAG: hypothetical protein VX265_11620 [Myxococcota bacterium]|nr:hypothetical protein [Myxococcota bacterium]